MSVCHLCPATPLSPSSSHPSNPASVKQQPSSQGPVLQRVQSIFWSRRIHFLKWGLLSHCPGTRLIITEDTVSSCLALGASRIEWSTDPDIKEPWDRGSPLEDFTGRADGRCFEKGPTVQTQGGGMRAAPSTWRSHKASPTRWWESQPWKFHPRSRQLRQNPPLSPSSLCTVVRFCVCLHHQTGSSWKMISC